MEFKEFNLKEKIGCVAGYHMNPHTCGVAKFNAIIAEAANVPHLYLFDEKVFEHPNPFFSFKVSEMSNADIEEFEAWVTKSPKNKPFSLFLHDFSDSFAEIEMVKRASMTYCGNKEIYEKLKAVTANVKQLWSPGTLRLNQMHLPKEDCLQLFTFGMAHKLRASYYYKLKEHLDQTGRPYLLNISTALHEGTSFDTMLESAFVDLHQIFQDRVRFLGYLSDAALYQYLSKSDYFVAFFQKGVRHNNSSVNMAMELGKPVISNLDSYSPSHFIHNENILDIERLETLPTTKDRLEQIGSKAQVAVKQFSWNSFFSEIVG